MTYSIHKNIIHGGLFLFCVGHDFLLWYGFLPNFLQIILTCIYLSFIPGYLISNIIRLSKIHPFQRVSMEVGLSLFFTMFFALAMNWLLPLFGISNPLTFVPLLLSFTITNLFLLLGSFLRYDSEIIINLEKKFKLTNIFLVVSSFFLPVLSILGAIRLNNGGSNIITMIFLILAGISILLVTYFNKKLSSGALAWYILMLGSATLLMFSLRSWYISGFDISREFFLFQLTKQLGYWSMSSFRDAYNACLSITILPTVISTLTRIPDEYVFKLLYPILFAFVPINIFFIARKFTNDMVALLSALFFISHPWFIDPMVTLARQEIGFIFFSLIIMTLFIQEYSFKKRTLLYCIFAATLVISHYSTTYVTISLLTLGFFGTYIFRGWISILEKSFFKTFIKRFKFDKWIDEPVFINGWYVLFITVFAYIWLSQLTGASSNFGDFFTKSIKNIYKSSSEESRSGIVTQVLTGKTQITSNVYSLYYSSKIAQYQSRNDIYTYSPSKYKDYNLVPFNSKSVSITSPTLFKLANTGYKYLLISIQAFFVSGIILSFLLLRKHFKLDYMILVAAALLMLAFITFLPYVSQEYNFDRLYLQTTVILSTFTIVGGMSLLYFISKFIKVPFTVIPVTMVLLMYWYSFGPIWQLVGGKTFVWLNNYGFYYDISFTHKGEIYAGYWLADKYKKKLVYTNVNGRNMLSAYTPIFTYNPDVFPPSIDRNSYVYVTEPNKKAGIGYFYYRATQLGYNFPSRFLEDNKNKVYSNESSDIFK